MRKIKVAVFCGFYPDIKGGAEYQARIIADELVGRGYDVFIISFGHSEVIHKTVRGIRVYGFPNPNKLDQCLLYESVGKKIRSVIEVESPDIVYQRILNSFSYQLAKIARDQRIKLYIHVADNYSLVFGAGWRNLIRKYFFHRILCLMRGGAKIGFFVQTRQQCELLRGLGVEPILQVYNMHPSAEAEKNSFPINQKLPTDKFSVFWIANIRPVKNLEVALEIADRLSDVVNLFVIGRIGGCKASADLIRKSAEASNISYLGEQDNNRINLWLSESGGLLLNTSTSEGFSNTFIQAWLRGVPVVSLNCDPDGVIENHGLGFIGHGSVDSVVQYIKNVAKNRYLLNDLATKCKLFAEETFSIEKNFETIVSEFERHA